jgi:actin-related protein
MEESNENNNIVIDNGTCYIKAGFCEESPTY